MAAHCWAPLLLLLLATTLACVAADATNPLGGAEKTVGGVQSRKDVNDGYRGGKEYHRGSKRTSEFEYKYADNRQYDDKPYPGPEAYYPPEGRDPSYGPPFSYQPNYSGKAPQTIRLRGVFPEDALNATAGLTPAQFRQNCALAKTNGEVALTPPECAYDFSLTCSHKRSYGYTASYSPDQEARLLPQSPKPAVIGTGLVAGTLDLLSPPFAAEEILYLDEHRPAHKVGTVYGAMYGFTPTASQCNPLLTPSTLIDFGLYQSPPADVYAMFTKIKIPADPAWAWNLWKGLRPAASGLDSGLRRVKTQSVDDANSNGYETASDGTKFVRGPGYTYVVDQKDDTLCGLTLVVKGAAAIHVPADRDDLTWAGGVSSVRQGFIESPFLWWNSILKLPGAKSEEVPLPDGTRKPAGRRSRIASSSCIGGVGAGGIGGNPSANSGLSTGGDGGRGGDTINTGAINTGAGSALNGGTGGTGGSGGNPSGGPADAVSNGGNGTGGDASGCNTSLLDLSTASLIGSEINIGVGGTQAVIFEQTLKYISAMCATADIPFADIGVWTIDVAGA